MKKKTHIMVYIISTLLTFTLGLGVAYSYLAVRFKGLETESTINIGMGTMTITYENNSGELRLEKAIPGASVSKEFTLVGKNDTVSNNAQSNEMYYKIGITVDNNTFTRGTLEYKLEPLDSSSNGQVQETTTGTVPAKGTKYIGSGYFEGSIDGVEHKYRITLTFPETGEDQSEEMGKEIGLHITVDQGTKIIDVSNNYPTDSLVAEILNKTDEEKTTDGLQEDDYGNLRYVGASPNNYITFNNETWRIIGLFDIEDQVNPTTIKTGKGIKIIREEKESNQYWNYLTKNDAGSYINNWPGSTLEKYLNETYYNKLSDYSKGQIAKVTWYLGGWNTNRISAANMYTYERGTTVYSGRPTEWAGNIALMYPSDYGYASTDTTCRNNLYNCNNDINRSNNWIYTSKGTGNSNYGEWLLSPHSSISDDVFDVGSSGRVFDYYVDNALAVRPSVYLSLDILKVSGNGTSEHPYTIE